MIQPQRMNLNFGGGVASPYTNTTRALNLDFGNPGSAMSFMGNMNGGASPSFGGLDQTGLVGVNAPGMTPVQMGGMEQSLANFEGANAGGEGMDFLGAGGWGNLALGGLQAGMGAFMGLKQLDLAKDQLRFQKEAFNKNYGAQRQTTNTNLEDRQRRRHYENPEFYQDTSTYMQKNGVK